MQLHDPHTTPEPWLVLSGLAYLAPMVSALYQRRSYDACTYMCITCTTVGFHGTRHELWFALDCGAIVGFLMRSGYVLWATPVPTDIRLLYAFAVLYSFTSYFVGQRYKIMSFHPNWNIQMAYHALMHLSTAYTSYLIMSQQSDKWCE